MPIVDDFRRIAAQRFPQGCAVVDLKFNEVFRFSLDCDAQVVTEWPDMFKKATREEEELLKASGESSALL